MSKELPYFKFIPTEYLLGTISFQKEKIQGTFTLVCCYYWQRHCDITLTLLNQLLSKRQANVKQLIKADIVKHDEKTDKINIDFLDEQWHELSNLYEKRSKAGAIGGKQSSSNRQAIVNDTSSIKIEIENKKEIKDKDKDSLRTLFAEMKKFFMEEYRKKINTDYYWGAKDAVNLNQLITKIKYKIKEKEKRSGEKEKENYDEEILTGFKHLILSSKDKWINAQFSIPIFNSKFNEIFTQILTNNGKPIINARTMADAMEKEFNPKQGNTAI